MATSGFAVVLPLQVRMLGSWCPRPSPINRMAYESRTLSCGLVQAPSSLESSESGVWGTAIKL